MTLATAASDSDTLGQLQTLVRDHKADGFILPRTKVDDPRIAYLRGAGVPFVLYGRTGDPADCAWFDIRGGRAMARAVDRLVQHGHRRIGFLPGAPGYNYADLRRKGYLAGLRAAGIAADAELIGAPAVTVEEGAAAADRLLALDRPPTAILCAVDCAALGIWQSAASHGLTIGRDLSVISYDGIREGALMSPALTTFCVDNRAAGARLAQMLIARIGGAAPEALRELADATLFVGGSDGPPRLSSDELRATIAMRRASRQSIKTNPGRMI